MINECGIKNSEKESRRGQEKQRRTKSFELPFMLSLTRARSQDISEIKCRNLSVPNTPSDIWRKEIVHLHQRSRNTSSSLPSEDNVTFEEKIRKKETEFKPANLQ